MKLYLALLGLFTIATPENNDGPVEVLFLNTAHSAGHVAGAAIPRHRLTLTYFVAPNADGSGQPTLVTSSWTKPLSLQLGSQGPVTLLNAEGFVDLGAVT